jgi:hypothetical protein
MSRLYATKKIFPMALVLSVLLLCVFAAGCGEKSSPAHASNHSDSTYDGPPPTLSEVMPVNTSAVAAGDGKYYPWVEIANEQSAALQLSDYYLTNSQDEKTRYHFPSVVITPGERRIVFLSGIGGTNGEMHAGFTLAQNDTTLYLYDLNGNLKGSIVWKAAAANMSHVAGYGGAKQTPFYTPGLPNDERVVKTAETALANESAPVMINEILRKNTNGIPDADGAQSPWVEIYNRSGAPVSLLGYCLSDDLKNPAKWLFPDSVIAPGEYKIIFLSGKDRYGGELHTSFTMAPESEMLLLKNVGDNTLCFIPVSTGVSGAFAIGRTDDGTYRPYAAPTPGAANSGFLFSTKRYEKPVW